MESSPGKPKNNEIADGPPGLDRRVRSIQAGRLWPNS